MKNFKQLIKDTPNDEKLGSKIRQLIAKRFKAIKAAYEEACNIPNDAELGAKLREEN